MTVERCSKFHNITATIISRTTQNVVSKKKLNQTEYVKYIETLVSLPNSVEEVSEENGLGDYRSPRPGSTPRDETGLPSKS